MPASKPNTGARSLNHNQHRGQQSQSTQQHRCQESATDPTQLQGLSDVCCDCVTCSVHAFRICVRGQQRENWLQGWVHIVPVTKRVSSRRLFELRDLISTPVVRWTPLSLLLTGHDDHEDCSIPQYQTSQQMLDVSSSLWLPPAFRGAGVPQGQLDARRNERQGPATGRGRGFVVARHPGMEVVTHTPRSKPAEGARWPASCGADLGVCVWRVRVGTQPVPICEVLPAHQCFSMVRFQSVPKSPTESA